MNYQLILEHDQPCVSDEALEAVDLTAATSEALAGFREILANHFRAGSPVTLRAIHLADAYGTLLASVTLQDAIEGILPVDAAGQAATG